MATNRGRTRAQILADKKAGKFTPMLNPEFEKTLDTEARRKVNRAGKVDLNYDPNVSMGARRPGEGLGPELGSETTSYLSPAVRTSTEAQRRKDPKGSYIRNNAGQITGWKPSGSNQFDFVSEYSVTEPTGSSGGFQSDSMDLTQDPGIITEAYYTQFKEQFGDQYSDEMIRALAQSKTKELFAAQNLYDQQAEYYRKQNELAQEGVDLAKQDLEDFEQKAQGRRDARLYAQERLLERQYEPQRERAREQADVETSTRERLLGATGGLTTRPGSQELRGIQDQLTTVLNSIDAQKNAELALYQAQLEGRDADTIAGLQSAYDAARGRALEQKGISMNNLLNAQTKALEAGADAEAEFLSDMIAAATADDPNIDIESSQANGFLVDMNGNPLLDNSGKLLEMPANFASGGSFNSGGRRYQVVVDKLTGEAKVTEVGSASGGGRGAGSGTGGGATGFSDEAAQYVESRRQAGIPDEEIAFGVTESFPGQAMATTKIKNDIMGYLNETTQDRGFGGSFPGIQQRLSEPFGFQGYKPFYTFDDVFYGGASGGAAPSAADDGYN